MPSLLSVAPLLLAQAKGGTWQDVSYAKIGLAAAICAVLSIAVGAILQGVIFHKFQRLTPSTWRPEGPKQYIQSMLSRAIGGVAFPLMYTYTGMARGITFNTDSTAWLQVGLKFGVLVWAAVALPQTLSFATFVNLHRNFVAGKLLDWLIVCVGCALVCTKVVLVVKSP